MKPIMQKLGLLIAMLCASLAASAYDFTVDGIYYNITDATKKTVAVTYEKEYDYTGNGYNSYAGTVVIPSEVKYNDKTYSVTSIGDEAFYDCSNLTTVTIPNSVTSIGEDSFYLSSISAITIPNSITSIDVRAFAYCDKLTTITIPNSINSINSGVFNNSGLTSVTIPGSINYISGSAFSDCHNLIELVLQESATELKIDDRAFDNSPISTLYMGRNISHSQSCPFLPNITKLTIGSKVNAISNCAFASCEKLTSVIIPNSVTSIEYSAFAHCSNLSSIVLSNSINSIGRGAFYCCNLTKIVIPPSVETIEQGAFGGNNGLKVLAMGHSVKTIGMLTFENEQLDSVLITTSEPPIAYEAFSGHKNEGKLFVQGEAAVDAYYDARFMCGFQWCFTEVMSEPAGMTLEGPEKVEGVAGEQFTLKAVLTPADVDLPYVFWRSTDPTKAYVDHKGVVTILEDVCEGDDWKIIAETLYANGPTAEFAINAAMNGVEAVEAEEAAALEGVVDVFNLQGTALLRNASAEEVNALKAGIYIVRSGNRTAKIAVK